MLNPTDTSPVSSSRSSQLSHSTPAAQSNRPSQSPLHDRTHATEPHSMSCCPAALDLTASVAAQVLNDVAAQAAVGCIAAMFERGWTADDIRDTMDALLAHATFRLHDLYTFESVVADAYFAAAMRQAILHTLQHDSEH